MLHRHNTLTLKTLQYLVLGTLSAVPPSIPYSKAAEAVSSSGGRPEFF